MEEIREKEEILYKESEILRKAGFTDDEIGVQVPNDIIRIAEDITSKGMTRKDFDWLFKENHSEELAKRLTIENLETEQIEHRHLENEFLEEFEEDNRKRW